MAALIKAPAGRSGRPSKSLTLEQAQEVLRAAEGSRLHAYVVLSVTTGLRTEKLRVLRWSEVGLDAGTVAVYRAVRASADTKTPKSRRALRRCRNWLYGLSVSISTARPRTSCWAGVLWEDNGLVFASDVGTPLDRHNVLREFRKITQAAGLGTDWVPREMRHTFVSLLSSNGIALENIADLVGTEARRRPRRSTGRSSCPNCGEVPRSWTGSSSHSSQPHLRRKGSAQVGRLSAPGMVT